MGPTCWFNALLMSVFYSERSRKMVVRASQTWNFSVDAYMQSNAKTKKQMKLYKIFKHLLDHKYKKTNQPKRDQKFFEDNRAEKILTLLNEYDNNIFTIHNIQDGGKSYAYIRGLYELLSLRCILIQKDAYENLSYDLRNDPRFALTIRQCNSQSYGPGYERFVKQELHSNPDILVIRCHDNPTEKYGLLDHHWPYMYLHDDDSQARNIKEINSLNDTITFNGVEYELDSVLLFNWDKGQDFHEIAGITCGNSKLVYNGWTWNNKPDRATDIYLSPCPLIPYNWKVKPDSSHNPDFCLNIDNCNLVHTPLIPNCFSFLKGQRTLVYVRKSGILDDKPSFLGPQDYVSYESLKTPTKRYDTRSRLSESKKQRVVGGQSNKNVKFMRNGKEYTRKIRINAKGDEYILFNNRKVLMKNM